MRNPLPIPDNVSFFHILRLTECFVLLYSEIGRQSVSFFHTVRLADWVFRSFTQWDWQTECFVLWHTEIDTLSVSFFLYWDWHTECFVLSILRLTDWVFRSFYTEIDRLSVSFFLYWDWQRFILWHAETANTRCFLTWHTVINNNNILFFDTVRLTVTCFVLWYSETDNNMFCPFTHWNRKEVLLFHKLRLTIIIIIILCSFTHSDWQ